MRLLLGSYAKEFGVWDDRLSMRVDMLVSLIDAERESDGDN